MTHSKRPALSNAVLLASLLTAPALAACYGGLYAPSGGAMVLPAGGYAAGGSPGGIKMNTIEVTNASSIPLCSILVDKEGHQSSLAPEVAPGQTGNVLLPNDEDYGVPAQREKIMHEVFTLRAFTCVNGGTGTPFRDSPNVSYFGDKPVIH